MEVQHWHDDDDDKWHKCTQYSGWGRSTRWRCDDCKTRIQVIEGDE